MFDCTLFAAKVVLATATSVLCLSLAVPIFWWLRPASRIWLFNREIDEAQRLQRLYGWFCIALVAGDLTSRLIPHRPLPWIQQAFLCAALLLFAALAPRIFVLARRALGVPG